jgi:hypothetical protein
LDTKRTWTVATVGPPKDRLNIYPAELLCEIFTSNQGFVWLTLEHHSVGHCTTLGKKIEEEKEKHLMHPRRGGNRNRE